MMDDHEILSRARNHLADALKALLRAEIMGRDDFLLSRAHTAYAYESLNALLRLADRNPS